MCLAIPGRITQVSEEGPEGRKALVDYPGLTKSVSLVFLPEARKGDYVLVQAGFAIRRLTPEEAREVLEQLESRSGTIVPPTPAAEGV